MRIVIVGTGVVGRTLAAKTAEVGHQVVIGTRDAAATLARNEPGAAGQPPFADWHAQHAGIDLAAYGDVGAEADLVINATSGLGSLAALGALPAGLLDGSVLVDVSNPLDFSHGFPPTLSVVNTDSVGEQIQRTFPAALVVKSLNTMNASVMTDPASVPGEHVAFVAGDDDEAKAMVRALLGEFGWPPARVLDLGGIRAARGLEMYLPLWLSLMGSLGDPVFNIAVLRG